MDYKKKFTCKDAVLEILVMEEYESPIDDGGGLHYIKEEMTRRGWNFSDRSIMRALNELVDLDDITHIKPNLGFSYWRLKR